MKTIFYKTRVMLYIRKSQTPFSNKRLFHVAEVDDHRGTTDLITYKLKDNYQAEPLDPFDPECDTQGHLIDMLPESVQAEIKELYDEEALAKAEQKGRMLLYTKFLDGDTLTNNPEEKEITLYLIWNAGEWHVANITNEDIVASYVSHPTNHI